MVADRQKSVQFFFLEPLYFVFLLLCSCRMNLDTYSMNYFGCLAKSINLASVFSRVIFLSTFKQWLLSTLEEVFNLAKVASLAVSK